LSLFYLIAVLDRTNNREKQMKAYLFFRRAAIVCIGIFLWVSCIAEAGQADWRILRQDTYGGTFYYDVASIRRTENNTITVWARADVGAYLYEIDCKNKKARILQGLEPAPSEWFAIIGGTSDELVYDAVCR